MKKIKRFLKENKSFVMTILILLGGQSVMYYGLKFFQTNPNYINYYLDDKIPFIGYFVYIYDLFYPLTFLALYYLYKKDKETYFKGIISGTIGYIICGIIFVVYPTIMYRPVIPKLSPLTDLVVKLTFLYDNPPLNCFPSIHCLFSFQVIYCFLSSKLSKRDKIIVTITFLLIIISTLLVKQHYIFDVISAFLICIITNLLEDLLGIYKKIKKKWDL